MFGPVERVDARLDITGQGIDQNAFLQLSHQRGGLSQLSTSFTALMSNTAALACSGGMIRLQEPLIGAEQISTRRMANRRTAPQDPNLPLRAFQNTVRTLRQSPLLRRLKQSLLNAPSEHLPYGTNKYLPQLEHFLALLKAGARESSVVPLELSLDIQRVIDRARADHRR